jgi:UDP-N-acetylglucosamine transferase subunit ALG13
MILVILGTQFRQFNRLLQEVEDLITAYNITDRVIVQCGHTNYESDLFELFKFIDNDQFVEYIKQADVIITHAGSGALFNAIKSGKKIIAVARLKEYREMVDNHQVELVKKLSGEGYIIDGTYSLKKAWDKLENFTPRPSDFPNKIYENLKKYIDAL